MSNKRLMIVFGVLTVASMLLASCGPQVEGTEVAGEELPYIPAEGLVACNDLPAELTAVEETTTTTLTEGAGTVGNIQTAIPEVSDVTYKVGIFSDITSLNYWQANGPDNTVWNSYVLTPERITLYAQSDLTFQLIPWAAIGDPTPLTEEGGKWVETVTMRDNILWSDGTPFTATDVAFSANTSLRFGLIAGNWGSWYDSNYLESVEAVDPVTVKFIWHTKPGLARNQYGALQGPVLNAAFWGPLVDAAAAPLEGLTRPAADAPEADLTAYATAETEAQNNLYAIVPDDEPLAGSFLVQKWELGAFVEAPAYEDFFYKGTKITEYANGAYQETAADVSFTVYGEATGDKTLEYFEGPFVATAIYTIYSNQNAALLALQSGEVDFVLNPLGLQRGLVAQIEGDPNLTVIRNNVNGFRYMSFNMRRQPMNYCAFRQAMAMLIDKEFVTNTILQKVAFPQYTFVPEANGAWYFADVPKIGQGLTREERMNYAIQILEAGGFSWEGDVKPTYDAEDNYVVKGGGLVMPDGTLVPELNLIAPSAGYDPLRSTFAIFVETWANEMGIPIKANLVGFNTLINTVYTEQDMDMYILGWSLSIFPSYMRDFWHSEQAVIDGNNAGGYTNPEFDALSEALLTCETLDACKVVSDSLQTMLSIELPYVVLFDTGVIEAYRNVAAYPYTDTLSGLQYFSGMPDKVTVR